MLNPGQCDTAEHAAGLSGARLPSPAELFRAGRCRGAAGGTPRRPRHPSLSSRRHVAAEPVWSQVLFGEFAKLVGHGTGNPQRHRRISDSISRLRTSLLGAVATAVAGPTAAFNSHRSYRPTRSRSIRLQRRPATRRARRLPRGTSLNPHRFRCAGPLCIEPRHQLETGRVGDLVGDNDPRVSRRMNRGGEQRCSAQGSCPSGDRCGG